VSLRALSCLLAAATLAPAGCERQVRPISLTRPKMSTLVTITVYDRSPTRAQKAIDAAFDRMDAVAQVADRHLADSEITRLARAGAPVKVSPELWRLLAAAKAMGERTGGAFDVTVGPLCRLWKRCAMAKRMPTPDEVQAAKGQVGIEGLALDEATHTAALSRPGMVVDLGAIAKGYAVDQAIAALKSQGIASALVNAGGDMRMIGPRPGADAWRIGVQDPREPGNHSGLLHTLHVPACAIATSGNYQRFFEIAGQRFSHIIDPRTGQPASRVPSVTVVSQTDAMTADMWATAASVLDPDEAIKLIDADPDLEALLVTLGPEGQVHERTSKGFPALIAK